MSKDQSYFLYGISQEAIDSLLFPLGEKIKDEIKKEALPILPWLGNLKEYKDSQEICFVEHDYKDVLKNHFDIESIGAIKDIDGNIIGSHDGYMQYTVGKRKGLRIKGSHEPHYVLEIDSQNNEIVAGKKEELAERYRSFVFYKILILISF